MMNIFFSWQSDLSKKNNKNFIEDCIKSAIKDLNGKNKYLNTFKLDKDTAGEPGNPNIVDVILEKIDNCKIFICDVSIINADYTGKKMPNPNVIFELGYAIKALGWEKIICIVNEEFGKIDKLPFDISHKRLVTYNLNEKEKLREKKKIIDIIKTNINILNERGLLFNELEDYFKRNIDTEFLTIINHLRKIVFETCDKNLLVDTEKLLNIKKEELLENIRNRKILGFHIFKNFNVNSNTIKKLSDSVVSTNHFPKDKIVVLLKFLEWANWYNNFTNDRTHKNLFVEKEESNEFKIIKSNGTNLPNRMILGKIIDDNHFFVYDFGDIIYKARIEKSNYYFEINTQFIEEYANLLYNFIIITNEWLDKTGGEFIIDTFNNFEWNIKINK